MPEDEETKSSPDWSGVGWRRQPVGLLVFLFASLVVLFVLFLVNLPSLWVYENLDKYDYKIFRSMEVILSVAGLGLMASFLSGTTNVVALIFGFFVVAALIIPSKDIIRFALIATGSDRSVNSYYGSATSGSSISSRTDDVSTNAALAIEQIFEQRLNMGPAFIGPEARGLIKSEIRAVLTRDRIETLIERVKARGAYELFEAINDEQSEEFLYRHSGNERIEHDLEFLRYEDLISMTYDNAETARVTDLGRDVIYYAEQGGAEREPTTNQLIVPSFNDWDIECSSISFPLVADILSITPQTPVRKDDVPAGTQFILVVGPGVSGKYSMTFNARAGTSLDPTMSLYKIDSENISEATPDSCQKIASNDDGDDVVSAFDSRLDVELEEGHYLVRLNSLGRSSGAGSFLVTRAADSAPPTSTVQED